MGSLNVHVTYPNSGNGKSNVRVVGENNNGMTQAFFTNRQGEACVRWASNTSMLVALYVDGKKYKGRFQSGSSYSFPARR